MHLGTAAAGFTEVPQFACAPEAVAAATPTLLEDGFPFRELSLLAKADRRGRDPSYGLHRWWARRPPALVRGILLAAFTPPSPSLVEFWRNFSSADAHLDGKRIHDPFLGGGSTVVEASRLGASTSGTDVDPLACLIARHELVPPDVVALSKYGRTLADHLIEAVGSLYGPKRPIWTPLHWFWIHVVECPSCKTRAALYRSLLIARDVKKLGAVVRDAAQTVFCPECFKIHQLSSGTAKRFDCCGRRLISESTFSALKFHCRVCGKSADHSALKTLKAQRRLLAIEETHAKHRRRIRAPQRRDRALLRAADRFLSEQRGQLAIPRGTFAKSRRDSRPASYGASKYTDLFHPRQLAAFGSAFAWIRDCGADAVTKEALTLATSHALAFNNRLCGYATDYGRLSALFSVRSYSLPALSVELNPLHPTAGRGTLLKLLRERLTETRTKVRRTTWDHGRSKPRDQTFEFTQRAPTSIRCASALATYPLQGAIDFSFFDPPYFDYIAYSELSEFYRAWVGCTSVGGTPLLPEDPDPVRSFAASFATAVKALRARLSRVAPFTFTFHSTSADAWRAIATALRTVDESVTAIWPVLADPHMGHHGAGGACEWDLVIVCRPSTQCRPRRGPSVKRWRKALRPLVVRPPDQAAFRIALSAFRGLFGSPTLSVPIVPGSPASTARFSGGRA
jgi:adenine-specific DNA methylase